VQKLIDESEKEQSASTVEEDVQVLPLDSEEPETFLDESEEKRIINEDIEELKPADDGINDKQTEFSENEGLEKSEIESKNFQPDDDENDPAL
jgi:hypothetical protein